MAEPDYDLDALIDAPPSASGADYDLDALIAGAPVRTQGSGKGIGGASAPPPAGENDADAESTVETAKRILVDQPGAFFKAIASDPKAAAQGFSKFGSFGFDDDAAGAGAAYGTLVQDLIDGKTLAQAIGNASAASKSGKKERRAETEAAAARSPESYGAGAVGGAALTLPLGGAASRAVPMARAVGGGAPVAALAMDLAPTAAQRVAAAAPAAVAGAVGLGDAETLEGDVKNAAVGLATAPLAAVAPAAARDTGDLLSGVANVADDAAAAAGKAGGSLAAENAARREAQQALNAAGPSAAVKAPSSFKDVVEPLRAFAQGVEKLSPKQQLLLKHTPVVGRALEGIKDLAKLLGGETEEAATKLPPEARELIDDVLRAAVDENPAGVVDDVARAAAPEAASVADEAVAAVDQTITPTPTPKARSGPKTPPTPSPAPAVEEATQTANVPRLPPPTQGLEPTEVIQRDVVEAVKPRRLSDDDAAMLIRKVAIENGTTDAATIASKAGLSSSQVTRVLPKLVSKFEFRNAVEQAAAKAAPVVEVATQAPAKAPPAADLLEGIAAQNQGGKVTQRTIRQEAAVQRAQAQAVTIGDFADRLAKMPAAKRGDFLRMLAKDKGRDFAVKVAKQAGVSTKGF